jgi:hypothetical protein
MKQNNMISNFDFSFSSENEINKVIAIIRRKYGEISGFVEFTRNIYTTQGRIKVKMCYFTVPFLGDPSWYILSQAVAIETRNLS